MNRRPHPNPALARRGVTLGASPTSLPTDRAPAQAARPDVGARASQRQPLIDELPEIDVISYGFSRLLIPRNFTVAADQCAWITLGRIRPKPGQELYVNSIEITQVSADTAGAYAVDAVAWGDVAGQRAAIVIGQNLPIQEPDAETWDTRLNALPFNYPGFTANTATPTPATPGVYADQGSYLWVRDWCIGSYTAAQPFKWSVPKHFGAFGRRISDSDSVDVALVLAPGTIGEDDPGADRYLYGHCAVHVFAGTTRSRGQFNRD